MTEQDIKIVKVCSINDAVNETVDITGYDSDDKAAPLESNESNPNYRKIPKSALSFTVLTSLAFKNVDYSCLTVQQIYSFITKHFSQTLTLTTDKTWKSSVRNTLCVSPYFIRLTPRKSGRSSYSRTLPSCSKGEKGLSWAVNPAMIVQMEDLIVRSAALAGSSRLAAEHKTLQRAADHGLVEELVVPEPRPIVFTQYKDGFLPLVTLYSETPGDYQGYADNYPVKF